jgi:hypothetical protein
MIANARGELDRAARSGDRGALQRAQQRFQTLAARVQAESAALTWGSADGETARVRFVARYGCTAWTEETLDEIAKHSPLVRLSLPEVSDSLHGTYMLLCMPYRMSSIGVLTVK